MKRKTTKEILVESFREIAENKNIWRYRFGTAEKRERRENAWRLF
jgi:hypothetical protein